MIKLRTIAVLGIALLISCGKSTEPDLLQSKDLQWKVGDRQIFHIERHTDTDTTYFDTSYVTAASVIDGYYTVSWSHPPQQARVRDGYYETRYKFEDVVENWTSVARAPSTLGEVLFSANITRRAPDGTNLGKVLVEGTTTSTDTTITVPAGNFRCMVSTSVEMDMSDRTEIDGTEARIWYAPGIGFVQIEIYNVTVTGGRQLKLRERTQLYSTM